MRVSYAGALSLTRITIRSRSHDRCCPVVLRENSIRRIGSPATSAPSEKIRSRSSTSYVPWELLMRRMLGIEVLQCVQCLLTMRAIANGVSAAKDVATIDVPASHHDSFRPATK